jgi:hypothetical protein
MRHASSLALAWKRLPSFSTILAGKSGAKVLGALRDISVLHTSHTSFFVSADIYTPTLDKESFRASSATSPAVKSKIQQIAFHNNYVIGIMGIATGYQ